MWANSHDITKEIRVKRVWLLLVTARLLPYGETQLSQLECKEYLEVIE
jgi:hypothetical protein